MLNRQGEMTYCALFNNTEYIDALEVSALSSPASHNQREEPFPQRKQPWLLSSKIPCNLKA